MSIIDIKKIEDNAKLECDICIIGSGMSGQIIASKIKNKKIIIIDSGESQFNEEIQNLNDIETTGLKFRENHINRIRQLGGSANLWANQLMFLEKEEIEKREWLSSDLSWIINYEDLKQNYLEIIKDIFNKSLYKFLDPMILDKNKFNSFVEEDFLKTKNISFKDHLWPSKMEKFNLSSNFTKELIKKSDIHFFKNCTATNFTINQNNQTIEKITVQSAGKKNLIKAKYFVLSCGGIENARILLNNQIKYKILENNNTGKYFMDHPRVNLGNFVSKKKFTLSALFGIKFQNLDFRKSISISKAFQKEKRILNSHAYLDPIFDNNDDLFYKNFLKESKKIIKLKGIPNIRFNEINVKKILQQIYFKMPPQVSNSSLNNLIRLWLNKKDNYLSFSKIDINYQGEQIPNIDSKIYLGNKSDKFNQKKVIVNWKLSKIDYETQYQFINILKNISKSHSYLSFNENADKEITDASHHSGTTRMSLSKSDGVVDNNCKFHGIYNLYISGSSTFRSIGSANPGLTNMAMSNRLGKYLNNL